MTDVGSIPGSRLRRGSGKLKPFGSWKPQPVTLPYSGPPLDLNRLLEVLARNEVDFVVVGGSAAGFLGASRLTEDADCVVRRERANLDNPGWSRPEGRSERRGDLRWPRQQVRLANCLATFRFRRITRPVEWCDSR